MSSIPVFLLAAGESSRMKPLTFNKHKTHLKVAGKSILQHSIESFLKRGFREIFVISSPTFNLNKVVEESVLSEVKVIHQTKPLGMGDAVSLIKEYVNDLFIVANGYHFLTPEIEKAVKYAKEEMLFLKKIEKESEEYGMVRIDKEKVTDIVEKPKEWSGEKLRVIGIYVLSKKFIENYLIKSDIKKDHYSFEKALQMMALNEGISFTLCKDTTPTLKYPWHYISYFEFILQHTYHQNDVVIAENASISERAIIDTTKGPVVIEKGAVILENALIKGPCYIGKNTTIGNNSLIRESNIEEECTIGYNSEITRSILQPHAKIHASYIGDSVIDNGFRSGYGFVTANRRIDGKKIKVKNKELERIGIIAGERVSIGANSTAMPGTVIMPHTIIYPNIRFKGEVEGVIKTSNF